MLPKFHLPFNSQLPECNSHLSIESVSSKVLIICLWIPTRGCTCSVLHVSGRGFAILRALQGTTYTARPSGAVCPVAEGAGSLASASVIVDHTPHRPHGSSLLALPPSIPPCRSSLGFGHWPSSLLLAPVPPGISLLYATYTLPTRAFSFLS